MTQPNAPKLSKWPFILGDLLLLAVVGWIVHESRQNSLPMGPWTQLILVVCTFAAAWIGVTPFLVEYRATLKFAESNSLTTAVEQINNLRNFTNQISFATAQWQVVQEQSSKTVGAAKEITDRMAAEAKAFSEFMQNANEAEKGHLRLEVEKLRRAEGDWLQVIVRLLDHVYALHLAGLRSGQRNVIDQLTQFQNACRDTARRMGLVAFEAQADEPFNEKTHQLADPEATPPSGARVTETLATGFTYQGQMVRCALVSLHAPAESVREPDSQLLLDPNS